MRAAQAAKETITAPVFSLAASAACTPTSRNYQTNPTPPPAPATWLRFATNDLTANSHQGHQLPTVVLYQGIGSAISNTASGLRVCLYDSGRRSRSTGKERDAESGLDYFGARYMSSAQGRFTSPDPSNLSVDFWLPQTWNRYSYALNNPLSMADRNGLWPFYIHDEIINEAFPGMSKQDLQTLKNASAAMDNGPGSRVPHSRSSTA